MNEPEPLDGALLIDKPVGPTSHDIVDVVRGFFGIKKVGHAGTLDPNATGLLVILIGRGTKLSERLMGTDKVYEGTIRFGISTDSYDSAGKVTETKLIPGFTVDSLNEAAKVFVGDIMQKPPMVSAVKKGGVPLYKLARKGIEIEREDRLIHVYRFKFTDYHEPDANFEVSCTKGTYVRSLAHDLGQNLACGAHLRQLRRTVSGSLNVADAIELEELATADPVDITNRIIPFGRLVADLAVG
jgi:tRNA pseudouridine55 synthase